MIDGSSSWNLEMVRFKMIKFSQLSAREKWFMISDFYHEYVDKKISKDDLKYTFYDLVKDYQLEYEKENPSDGVRRVN